MFSIEGLYIGSERRSREFEGRTREDFVISIASGIKAYIVYLKDASELKHLEGFSLGDPIRVQCEPYVGRNGGLSFLRGHVVE